MRRPPFVALAILAALLGAPSVVFGANELFGGEVSPTVGDTSTVFTLQVDYVGLFAALHVDAEVAGTAVPMELSAGTAREGRWNASTRLPAGTWPVVFVASVGGGNPAVLAGPLISVAGGDGTLEPVETSTGTAPVGPMPAQASDAEASAGSSPAAPAESVAGEPLEPEQTASPGAVPASGSTDGRSASSGDQAPAPPRADPRDGSANSDPAPASGGEEDAVTSTGTIGAPPATAGSPGPAGRVTSGDPEAGAAAAPTEAADGAAAAERPADRELAGAMVVMIAWLAAFVAAVIAVLIVVAARRRARRMDAAEALLAADETDAILRRRAIRRARVHLTEEDPIVAALGIPDGDDPRRRR